MTGWLWFKYRLKLAWWVIRYDSTAFAEALSGLFLIGLRGALLLLRTTDAPYDVVRTLYSIGVTEDRWGTWLLVCGILQVVFAGSRHSTIRLVLKVLIVVAFVVVTTAYVLTGEGDRPAVISLVCMIALYTGLMIRVFHDRRTGVPSLEERHAGHRG